ncbi:RIB43A-like with coiled-coils protein 1-like [Scleropages formosus]|uniref:RIB43A-like with coiled-coils protein 1 n=1 Tax=Scleropages formosus TaxID=113540 RepID=A0A0P7TVY9_SCLFO|nr:RIB43A-like with coiled-coils protein 1-like [Scleropages formosus]
MYKLNLPGDDSEAMATERRRAAEAARKKRIFNARSRIMGVDLKALDQQVAEKRDREEQERQREKAFELLRMRQDVLLMQQHKEEEDRRLELSRELEQLRAIQQRAQDSRDDDLHRSHQEAAVPSLRAPPAELGPASMQIFQGEDAEYKERKRAQMEACKKALRAQGEEKERLCQQQRHMELLRDMTQLQNDLREVQLSAGEEDSKRTARIALDNYNRAQAEQRAERQKKERLRAEEEELMEVWHSMTSDFLTERPEAALRTLEKTDRGKEMKTTRASVLIDRWKGMSAEQLSAIHMEQREQCAEKERNRNTEKQREAVWDSLRTELARQEEEEEGRVRRKEREKRVEMDRYNKQLAVEHSAQPGDVFMALSSFHLFSLLS